MRSMTSRLKNAPELILVADSPKPSHDWRSAYGIALPVVAGESAIFPHSHFAQLVEKELGSTLTELASHWPEISGKAGDLQEIAVSHKSIADKHWPQWWFRWLTPQYVDF